MTKRREFDRKTKVEILRRCKVETGFRCEKCGAIVAAGEIDHIDADALQIDKTRKLTAEEGQFLCEPCHDVKTKDDVRMIAKAKRNEAKHLGAKSEPAQKITSRGFEKKTKDRTYVDPFAGLPRRICGRIVE